MKKTCIVIVGPTASGKTALAIDVAQYFNTEIISADSRQCFKELNIGVAKPNDLQLNLVPHHFINSHNINDNVSAADFESFALTAAYKIFENNNIAVMCGGTGLYIKAFTEGLDPIPTTDIKIKKEIADAYEENGLEWLQNKVKKKDPLFWEEGEINNPHRLLRALEVFMQTGISIIAQQKKIKKQRPFNVIKIGIDIDRQVLYDRINSRVDAMMEQGLELEAKLLLPYKQLNALHTVGYRELFNFFEGLITRGKAFELIKQNSRRYAKRQVTWFKKDEEIIWLQRSEILSYLKNNLE
jgi:tRNA dimethylallyltransferase